MDMAFIALSQMDTQIWQDTFLIESNKTIGNIQPAEKTFQ